MLRLHPACIRDWDQQHAVLLVKPPVLLLPHSHCNTIMDWRITCFLAQFPLFYPPKVGRRLGGVLIAF